MVQYIVRWLLNHVTQISLAYTTERQNPPSKRQLAFGSDSSRIALQKQEALSELDWLMIGPGHWSLTPEPWSNSLSMEMVAASGCDIGSNHSCAHFLVLGAQLLMVSNWSQHCHFIFRCSTELIILHDCPTINSVFLVSLPLSPHLLPDSVYCLCWTSFSWWHWSQSSVGGGELTTSPT